MKNKFLNANDAFHYYYWKLLNNGEDFDNTKALFNIGFTIERPWLNTISDSDKLVRGWKEDYAEAEWQWYMTADRKPSKLGEIYGKIPEIWICMMNEKGEVNSNYGYQWTRGRQLDNVISILNGLLNMCIKMRSNDLWYGFCNDQYCFSKLQSLVAHELDIPIGTYYHFAHNLHLYNNIIESKKIW